MTPTPLSMAVQAGMTPEEARGEVSDLPQAGTAPSFVADSLSGASPTIESPTLSQADGRSAQIKTGSLELAQRIETIADDIETLVAAFRINSISQQLQQLREISQEIRELSADNDALSLKDLAARALPILIQLFDTLGTQQGARLIIAGAAAGILASGGWPAVWVYGLTNAVFLGKDAFIAFLKKKGMTSGLSD